jgi:branched-chain amino acid transport system substrate-binding protein
MERSTSWGTSGSRRRRRAFAAIIASGLFVVACGGGDGESTDEPMNTEAPDTSEAPSSSEAPGTSDAPVSELPAPTGEEMVVGIINTEGGAGGLDFPDIRRFIEAANEYTSAHGGLGNRPVRLETCVVKGSPETSQACAQELVGKNVELVVLGLDLFPDYKTFEAAGIPVIGVLPILPPDYTANALFLTGGNATSQAASAALAKDYFKATKVGIIHADNAGANSTAGSLTAALDKAGIAWKTVKGGDNETDAGFQGLMRQAVEDDPDLLVSLYSDAGCIGTMRARASLGITIPVISTSICADKDVIDVVGDEATGWYFAGLAEDRDTPERALQRRLLAPAMGIEEDEVSTSSLGLGGLGYTMWMSLVDYGSKMLDEGIEMTGQSLFDYLKTGEGLFLFGGDSPIMCGSNAKYPAVCSFVFPFAMYKGDGVVGPIDDLESVTGSVLIDSSPYLP